VIGPAGGSRTVGGGSGSYTTGRGTTIDYGGAGRTATGPGGTTAGRGVGGVQVTTPGGQTATKVGTAGGIKGPGGNGVAAGRSIGGTTGPLGNGVGASRGGVAVGPGGVAAGGTRVGAAAGPAGHYTAYRSTAAVRTQAGYVRTGFRGYNYFNQGWYVSHPGAWRAAAWGAAAYWAWAPYSTVSTFCGYPEEPVVYDYGSNVVYVDDRVISSGEVVGTAEEYANQATEIASAGQAAKPPEQEEWQSLGVFGLIQGEEKETNNLFQLAINKDGVIRGNYYSSLTDTTMPVAGSVDKKTQRAAWFVGDKKEIVYETGLGNLSQPETSMLVHFGKDRTQQWTLVRMEKPPESK
jgi:hypothetical protein